MHAKSLQSHLTLCNPMDCGPPGSSVHGVLQARTLEWVPLPSPRQEGAAVIPTLQARSWGHFSCTHSLWAYEIQGTVEPGRKVISGKHWMSLEWFYFLKKILHFVDSKGALWPHLFSFNSHSSSWHTVWLHFYRWDNWDPRNLAICSRSRFKQIKHIYLTAKLTFTPQSFSYHPHTFDHIH